MKINNIKKTISKKAFTVVEMLVVVGIFVMISGVILFNSKSFSSSANLQNVMQDLALAIRKAQGYALGFQTPSVVGGTITGFGVYFGDIKTTNSAWQKKYVIYGDFNDSGAGAYNPAGSSCGTGSLSAGSECLEVLSMTTGEKISNVCLSYNGTSNQMSGSVTGTNCVSANDAVTMYFNRPKPDAQFCWFKSASPNTCVTTISSNAISDVSIEVTALNNSKKIVTVWNTGQIGIK